ncbi:nucleoid-associated protein YejK [Flocculibacter collagenilyticus]|uniref:nucleoid-associated protein YejK n=1 Tax=Flocculibacter collagenilyticus TaxID=2744479 RepID=UPI0018F76B6C|nr:nucleoid-associated protein YejK [Flocculibacter collagenilyticus]
MSIEVNRLVINYLEKREDGDVISRIREQDLLINEKVAALMEKIHFAYNSKPGKGFCCFSDEKSGLFASTLESYHTNEISFHDFAGSATQQLGEELKKYAFDETGYLLVADYEYLATRYVFIMLLNIQEHFSVSAEMDILTSRHLDLSKMQLAARVDLTEYKTNPESNKYISFIKGRAGRKVSDFFLDFLGCEEGVDAKQQSKVMLDAVEDFISTTELDHGEKTAARKEVYDYCNERVQLGEEANVNELSSTLNSKVDEDFSSFYKEQGYELEEQFPVDKKTITTLVKFSGQGGGLSLGFEKKLLGDRIIYQPETDTMIIKGLPPNLKDQLMRYLTRGDE